MSKTLIISMFAAVLLSSAALDAQRGGGRGPAGTPPGHGGTPPGHGGTPPGQTVRPFEAPEFDAKSSGAVLALIIGGSLVLLETRRRRRSIKS